MFNNPPPGGAGKESPVQRAIGGLGTVGGIMAAIYLAPHVFHLFKDAVTEYLLASYGEALGTALVWLMAVVAVATLYFAVKLLLASALTWLWMAIGKRSV